MDLRQRGVALAVGFLVTAAALGAVVMVAGPAWASSPSSPPHLRPVPLPSDPVTAAAPPAESSAQAVAIAPAMTLLGTVLTRR